MAGVLITEPGVYDMAAEDYHADPVPGGSLSSSGARKLITTCPAKFRYELDHPAPPTDAMELGTAAHRLVLGVGADLVEVKAKDWRTKAAKDAAEKVRAAGAVPLLTRDYKRVHAMAAALRSHRLAAALLAPAPAKTEQTLVWFDAAFGIWRRAMLDRLPSGTARRPLVVDYKTTSDVSDGGIAKSVARYGYDQQSDFYLDGFRALGLGEDAAFLFVFQETDPPHLTRVCELDDDAMHTGARLNRQAMEIYRDCRESGIWPGYPDEVHLVSLPTWALNRHMEDVYS